MNENKIKFQKLTPIDTADISVYKDALDFVFEDEDLKNIALSGAYGSGKSSVLETYKKHKSDKKFLHISLTHFTPTKGEDSTIGNSVLEGKILNQLIHQIDPKRIPQTNFRVKQRVSFCRIVTPALLLLLFMLTAAHTVFFGMWSNYVSGFAEQWLKNALLLTTSHESRLLSGIICTLTVAVCISVLIKMQVNRGIVKRLGTDKVEIEIFQDSSDSYFDKYLNEVLYLFEHANADVIVFENMDRYNKNNIFEHLQEINTLINTRRKELVKKRQTYKPLRFFYLLRDDIFISKDRTKFFDYIVPIIPILDSSNSYDQFIMHLKDGGVYDLFDDSFLQGFSLYIDDMRVLKNIYNEFTVYYKQLHKSINNLNPNKMLAMIAYKNIFPKDFSDSQLRKGFVSTLFRSKEHFIANEISNINKEIDSLEEQINKMNDENLESVDEIYTLNAVKRGYDHGSRRNVPLEKEYDSRKERLENKLNEKSTEYEATIERLKQVAKRVSNETLKNIITRKNRDEIFSLSSDKDYEAEIPFSDIQKSEYFDLLKFLISNGYIDETYSDYMTYFYPESLSQTDKVFLLSISNQKALDYTYELKDPIKVIRKLNILSFEEPETLNFSLMIYLLENRQDNRAFLDAYLIQLRKTNNVSYVEEFLTWSREWQVNDNRMKDFVNELNASWDSFICDICDEQSNISEKCRDRFILLTLYHSSNDLLKKINHENCLTCFISDKADFLNIDYPDITKLISSFSTLEVLFHSLDFEISNKMLFESVYENDLYVLIFDNIAQMLVKIYGVQESDDLKHKNYSLIQTFPKSPLAKYVSSYINDYVSEILRNCDEKIADDECDVLSIINNGDIDSKTKEQYIDYLITGINDITTVTDSTLWEKLIDCERIINNEKNVIEYFKHSEFHLSNDLVRFINTKNGEYDYSTIKSNYSNDTLSSFFEAILTCDEIGNLYYKSILKTLNLSYQNRFTFEEVPDDKMMILIDLNIIHMATDSLLFIREHYSNNIALHYIEKNIKNYVEIMVVSLFDYDELLSVLDLKVADSIKLKLLEFTDESISVINTEYSDNVMAYILSRNFQDEDLREMLIEYSNYGKNTKNVIESKTIRLIDSIFENEFKISIELFENLFINTAIDSSTKRKLFVSVLPFLNLEQCVTYLPSLELDGGFLSIFDGKRPQIRVNDINERILKIFKKKGWITRFSVDVYNQNFYRAIGRKLRTE